MTSELKPLADMHPCPPASGGGRRHRSRVYADGRQHYCERCGEKIDATTFSNIPETYVTTHDAGDYNKPRAVPDVPELVRYSKSLLSAGWTAAAQSSDGEYVLHSQAAEIIAEKDKEIERLNEQNDKFKWQVRDTCTRAEAAEAKLAPKESFANIAYAAGYYQAECNLPEHNSAKSAVEEYRQMKAKLAQYEAQKPFGYVVERNSLSVDFQYEPLTSGEIESGIKATAVYVSPAPSADVKAKIEEYFAAKTAYDDAVKPNGAFGQPKILRHHNPIVQRYVAATAALKEVI